MSHDFRSARRFYVLASLTLAVIAMYYLRPVLAPLCIAFIIAVTLMPATRFLERHGLGASWAALTVVFAAAFFMIAVAISVGWQVSHLAENSPGLVARAQEKLYKGMGALEREFPRLKDLKLSAQFRQKLNESVKNTGENLTSALADVLGILGNALLVPMYVYFILAYRHFFRRFFHRVFDKDNDHIDDVIYKAHEVTQHYLSGLFTVMLIVACLNFIGLVLFQVPYALFFAVLASVLMIIPYVGVFIGSLLPVLFTLITHESAMSAVGVALWMWAIQLLEGNFITPNLVGSKVSINPFVALISLLLLGQLWGLPGLVVAMPMVAVLKVLLDASPSTEAYGMLLGDVPSHDEPGTDLPGKGGKSKPSLKKRLKKAISA